MNEKIDPPQGNFYQSVSNFRGFKLVFEKKIISNGENKNRILNRI